MPVVGNDLAMGDRDRVGADLRVERFHEAEGRDVLLDIHVAAHGESMDAGIGTARAEVVEGSGEAGTVLDDDLAIACGEGAIRPVRLQRAGKPAMDRGEFLRGNKLEKGARFS